MNNILVAARDLKIGGIEKSLITLLDYLNEHGYNITLVLEKNTGELLQKLNTNIKVVEYMPCSIVFMPLRKLINFAKQIIFKIKFKNKFDIAISYTTYSKVCSFIARCASKNSILWIHADYLAMFNGDIKKTKKFFEELEYEKFFKKIFVSKSSKKSFTQIFPEQKNVYVCNNLIDKKDIIEKSKQEIDLEYDKNIVTFLNVGRHDEKQKRLTRIIEAANILNQELYNFRVILIGSGKDNLKYKKLVKKYKLENRVIFGGAKENPYPYFKIADCVILSSDYEGYPVVFLESFILNKPIITTKVADYEDIDGRGIITGMSSYGIYSAMKEFINNQIVVTKKFDDIEYNENIRKKLEEILKNS